ncbi:succinate dehydrogenase subunit 4, mitochondrial-like isoform X2 [Lolium rigidum]|uniref:succinate dehydrogenase subunit 4, mitochondrial-like isoform X2 n=1 Tax=Lolium rigidum TaxID=89674 RepID=UPI001F5C8663|nr:succinate dehydrogenase subunit 4, mitochondrial-like isoform X2 [Lolium rigidum]
MASRLLTRSKALALAVSRSDAAPLAGARGLRALSTLPRDPAAAPAPSPRQPAVRGSPLGLSKILGYEQASRLSGTKVLPRWFSTGASNGSSDQQTSKSVAGMVQSDAVKAQQEGASAKVTAFSPSEATIGKYRISPLTDESKRVRKSEIRTKVSYYMIPILLLVSKNSVSTSLLVAAVYHQIYMFNKEIFLDYVHHDITRKWALIYFKLLLLVMAKDTMVYFGLF